MSTTVHPGKLVLIVGPSGVGKGTLTNILRETQDFLFPVSVTTRLPREGEVDGEVYHFISDDEFERMKDAGELLEWAVVHATKKYATLKKPIVDAINEGKVVIREVDIQGMISIQHSLPRESMVSIFISPPDLETIKQRILHRQPEIDPAELQHRLDSAQREMAQKSKADHEVVSRQGKVEELVDDVLAIIRCA